MGSSFIEYKGRGFWSYDRFIGQLAGETSEIISALTQQELWRTELVMHWKGQSSGDFNGWVHLKLDEFLVSEARKQEVVAAVQTVIARHCSPDDPIRHTGILLCKLLNGELHTTASDPLDYMVRRNS
jgi:hypothetical protein